MWPTPNNPGPAPSDDSWLLVNPSSTASEPEPCYVLSSTTDPYSLVSRRNDGIADPYYFISHRNSASAPRASTTPSFNTHFQPSRRANARLTQQANPATVPRSRYPPPHSSSTTTTTTSSQSSTSRQRRRGGASTPSTSSRAADDDDDDEDEDAHMTTTDAQSSRSSSSINSTWGSRSSDPDPPRHQALPPIWSPSLDLLHARTAQTETESPRRRRRDRETSSPSSSSRRGQRDHDGGGSSNTARTKAGLSFRRVRAVSGFYEGLRRERDAAEWEGDAIEPEREVPRSRRENIDWVLGREMGRIRGDGR